jgi:hypothetical protein
MLLVHSPRFIVPHPRKAERGDMEMLGVRPRYVVSALRFLFVDQLISNLHTSIILRIGALRTLLCVLAIILKIAAKMATIMAAMATIFKSHLSLSHSSGQKSSKKWRSFWQPFLRWPPKCVKFRNAPISTKIYM